MEPWCGFPDTSNHPRLFANRRVLQGSLLEKHSRRPLVVGRAQLAAAAPPNCRAFMAAIAAARAPPLFDFAPPAFALLVPGPLAELFADPDSFFTFTPPVSATALPLDVFAFTASATSTATSLLRKKQDQLEYGSRFRTRSSHTTYASFASPKNPSASQPCATIVCWPYSLPHMLVALSVFGACGRLHVGKF